MSTITTEQLELCEVCEHQKYTVKQGLICNLSGNPAEFEKDCDNFIENSELKAFRDRFRHMAYINEKATGIEVRLANYILDIIFILIFSVIVTYLLSMFHKTEIPTEDGPKFFNAFYIICTYLLYYFILESLTSRTLAKFITRTVVITIECKKPTLYNIFIRTVSRLIPLEPLSFLGDEPTGWHDDLSKTVVIFK